MPRFSLSLVNAAILEGTTAGPVIQVQFFFKKKMTIMDWKLQFHHQMIQDGHRQGYGVPQGRCPTGGGGLARIPNLRVCKHPFVPGWHTQGGKGELPSCRGTVQSAWQKLPVRREEEEPGCPQKVSGRHVVRGRQSSPILEVRPGNRQGW